MPVLFTVFIMKFGVPCCHSFLFIFLTKLQTFPTDNQSRRNFLKCGTIRLQNLRRENIQILAKALLIARNELALAPIFLARVQ